MSLDRFVTGSPLSANFPSPIESDQWLAQEFADDLFSGTSDLDHALSGVLTVSEAFVPQVSSPELAFLYTCS